MKVKNYQIKLKFIRNGIGFLAVVAFLFFISYKVLENWHDKTVTKNSVLCNAAARKLLYNSKEKIEHFAKQSLFSSPHICADSIVHIDTSFIALTKSIFTNYNGLEGGFYLKSIDKFVGYSYPTSPPPIPKYGPPPRSYDMIYAQCIRTIRFEDSYSELHNFDPAIFPLVTIPVFYKNEIIAAIWVRIHIEKDLPLIKLQSVANIIALLLIIILIIVLWFFYKLRINIQNIRTELSIIHHDSDYRLQNRDSLFIGIVNSVNQTLEKLQDVNKRKIQLEYQLFQKEKMASIGRIVAGVAHEVRTPLAIIKTRVQIWQKMRMTEQLEGTERKYIDREAMELVVKETNRLSNLIKKLLMFSKPINKRMQDANILDLLKEIVNILQIQKGNSKIDFVFEANNIPHIEVDRSSIYQVFINVLSNSMEAMPEGGTINIKIFGIEDHTKLKIEIVDQGVGIPEHILNNIFELFVTSKVSGIGLGLSISYEILKAHFGEINFENLEKGGVKCSIILPVHQNRI